MTPGDAEGVRAFLAATFLTLAGAERKGLPPLPGGSPSVVLLSLVGHGPQPHVLAKFMKAAAMLVVAKAEKNALSILGSLPLLVRPPRAGWGQPTPKRPDSVSLAGQRLPVRKGERRKSPKILPTS